jgi:hypothetical protein
MIIDPFYKPDGEITQQLIQRINQRRAGAMRRAITDLPPDADGDSSESDELQLSIIAALEDDVSDPNTDDDADRRWLGEIVYHFLGRLARRSRREGASEFNLNECIVEGMRVRLGLDAPEDIPLLEELADDFSNWLIKWGTAGYVAGWARIVVDPNDHHKFCFKPLTRTASPVFKAMSVNATLSATMRGAALDGKTESNDH